ncbi:MAG: DUF5715 family protein [Clostridium sp.]|nr:DUF5715 family protein [Clostridium sp.]
MKSVILKRIVSAGAVVSLLAPTAGCGGSSGGDGSLTPAMLAPDTVAAFSRHLGYMPEPCVDMHVNYLGKNYGLVFNDSNYVHLAAATETGIPPLTDLRSHWQQTRGLTKIVSCRDFFVENLTYSRPFLVPAAARMLHEVGRRFNDTLRARGGGNYRIKITSVMRTPESVRRLRRRNVNAVDSSVHSMGTTVDISHSSFICDSLGIARSVNDLKGILSEVLFAMRNEGKCFVKYERKQPCFHITVRPCAEYDNLSEQ